MKIKSITDSKAAFVAGGNRATEPYKKGIAAATDWQSNAIAAKELYNARIQEAIAAGRREKGLAEVSDTEWRNAALNVGAGKIAGAIVASQDKWAKEVSPYFDALSNTTLPVRTADPMTNVQNRVGGVVKALISKKKEIKG